MYKTMFRLTRFEPERVRSPQATTHRRNAPSGRLDRRADRRAIPARVRLHTSQILRGFLFGAVSAPDLNPDGFGRRRRRRTGATRRAVGLTDAPAGAQSRLASVCILRKICGGFYLVCRRARFEPGRVRSPQVTTHRRNAPSGRLDRRADRRAIPARVRSQILRGFLFGVSARPI